MTFKTRFSRGAVVAGVLAASAFCTPGNAKAMGHEPHYPRFVTLEQQKMANAITFGGIVGLTGLTVGLRLLVLRNHKRKSGTGIGEPINGEQK